MGINSDMRRLLGQPEKPARCHCRLMENSAAAEPGKERRESQDEGRHDPHTSKPTSAAPLGLMAIRLCDLEIQVPFRPGWFLVGEMIEPESLLDEAVKGAAIE